MRLYLGSLRVNGFVTHSVTHTPDDDAASMGNGMPKLAEKAFSDAYLAP